MAAHRVRSVFGLGLAAVLFAAAGGGTASAATPVGTCTNSYAPYTFAELSAIDPGLTPALFSVIDGNADGVVCFKPYSNGPHDGHAGNLVDDKAAPHA